MAPSLRDFSPLSVGCKAGSMAEGHTEKKELLEWEQEVVREIDPQATPPGATSCSQASPPESRLAVNSPMD